mmetsp:Transcript_6127/g.13351  ORF Transcript_6127/g.13351 Transcript_6127/m.13351 type:complete len:107 (-) Transcript_6127:104-424(-)
MKYGVEDEKLGVAAAPDNELGIKLVDETCGNVYLIINGTVDDDDAVDDTGLANAITEAPPSRGPRYIDDSMTVGVVAILVDRPSDGTSRWAIWFNITGNLLTAEFR